MHGIKGSSDCRTSTCVASMIKGEISEQCCHLCQHFLMNTLNFCLDCIKLEAPMEEWMEILVLGFGFSS